MNVLNIWYSKEANMSLVSVEGIWLKWILFDGFTLKIMNTNAFHT